MTEGDGPPDPTGEAFLSRSRAYLTGEYLPKLRRCVRELPGDAIWWRPNEASNSVGNLLPHLAGNVGQWIVSGVGGAADVRERQAEFDRRDGLTGPELLANLERVVAAADEVLAGLKPATLGERRVIQGREVTVLDAVYHAVEHFAGHTAQIIYITKLRTGRDLGFWRVEGGSAHPAW